MAGALGLLVVVIIQYGLGVVEVVVLLGSISSSLLGIKVTLSAAKALLKAAPNPAPGYDTLLPL